MTSRTNREVGPDKRAFAHGTGAAFGPGRFSPLSLGQFGSTTLSGGDLNEVVSGKLTVGKLTGPLPHKSSTSNTNATLTSWRKSGVLPHSAMTAGSTFGT